MKKPDITEPKLVVGLGNPGRQYLWTRHNAGWLTLDRVAEICGISDEEDVCEGILARSGELLLFKPLTYMNRSGRAAMKLLDAERLEPDDMLVVLDEVDLPLGSVRLSRSGSSGGHRGLKSVIRRVGTKDFARLRLGIGPCPTHVETSDFVLSEFSDDEEDTVEDMVEQAARAALCWAGEGVEVAMNEYNFTASP